MMLSPATNTNMIYLIFVSVFLFFETTGCNQRPSGGEIAGGPCSYDFEYFPAVVVATEPINDTYIDLMLLRYMYEDPDTIYSSFEANGNLSKALADSLQIKPGDTLAYEHMRIKSGACTPDIYTLRLERYSTKATVSRLVE